jgi:hypothetical protein
MDEQMELSGVGLSRENREKVNTKIWIVGDENAPMVLSIRNLGYQVRCFLDGEAFRKEFLESEKEPDCNLVIVEARSKTENLYETEFVLEDVRERPDLNVSVIFFTEDNREDEDLQAGIRHLESMGGIYVTSSENEESLISKIEELTKKSKNK